METARAQKPTRVTLTHPLKLVQERFCARHVRQAAVFSQHVIAQADGREEIASTKRGASSEGGGPSVQTAPFQGDINYPGHWPNLWDVTEHREGER